ncbi:MAG: pseudouridine synthase [Cognatishimia sp.]
MTKDSPKPASQGDRIAKVLARVGIASRREAERMIEAGRVSVNGEVLTSPALNVTGREKILVDGKPIAEREPERIWLYHKPTGLVTSHSDEKGRATIFEDLPATMPKHVMTVGRLDINSEGLLLLTNDGDVKRKLELPSTGWVRKYRVRVNGRPTEDQFKPLRDGITVDGERFAPMTITLDRQQGANAWVTVALREGKNREIRRAMEAIDLKVNRLIRVSYGPFQLGDLKQGSVEELRRRVVRDQLGLDGAVAPEERKTPARRRKSMAGKPGTGQPFGAKAGITKPAGGKPTGTPARKKTYANSKTGRHELSNMDPTKRDPSKSLRGKSAGGKPTGGKPSGSRSGGKPSGGKPNGPMRKFTPKR